MDETTSLDAMTDVSSAGPQRVIILAMEATGPSKRDRIVSLAAIRCNAGIPEGTVLHLVFDPRRDSQPEAAAIHGFDEWTLRHQHRFADLAAAVRQWLAWADLLVMHHAAFDLPRLQRELRKAGEPEIGIPSLCTMEVARKVWPGPPSSLDACLARIGLARQGQRHSAFEDAWLTMNLYRSLVLGLPPLRLTSGLPAPMNLQAAPPAPLHPLPPRQAKRQLETPIVLKTAAAASVDDEEASPFVPDGVYGGMEYAVLPDDTIVVRMGHGFVRFKGFDAFAAAILGSAGALNRR